MRWFKTVLVAVLLAASPVRAEVSWIDVPGSYELSGAQLFGLRAELPSELNESLKSLRNQSFADEAGFRAALAEALLNDELRATWTERLMELARAGGGSFGIEPLAGDLLTITVSGPNHTIDDVPFTAQSWLSHLPEAAEETSFETGLADGCLVVSRQVELFRLCQPEIGATERTVVLETRAEHIVGLGQEFQVPGETTAERKGFVRAGANLMGGYIGGAVGNTLFPIA